jgi:hypothetical protein
MWIPRVESPDGDDLLPVFEVTSPGPPGSVVTMRTLLEDPSAGLVLVKIEAADPGLCARLTTDFADLVHGETPDGARRPPSAARARLRKVVDDARTRFNAEHAGNPEPVKPGRSPRTMAARPELVEFDSG